MDNNSRISDEKDTELSRRLLAALSDEDFDEVKKIEGERESLEASARTVPASEAVGESIKRPQESDLYIPEEDEDTKIVFSDDDDDTLEDGRVDPMEGLNLQDSLEEDNQHTNKPHVEEASTETPETRPRQEPNTTPSQDTTDPESQTSSTKQTPQTPKQETADVNEKESVLPQVGQVSADTAQMPSTSSDYAYTDSYDYDESNETEKTNPFKKLAQWVMEDETGNRKWIAIGGAAILVTLLILFGILITGNKEEEGMNPEPVQETQQTQENPQQQAAELPGVIQPVNVTTRCANEDSDPSAMFDPNKTTAWICQRAMGVDGVVAEIDFGKDVTLTQVSVVPGFDYLSNTGTNEWTNYRAVNRISWQFDESGKETVIQDITPAQGSEATKTLESPITTRKIYMKIMGTQKSDPAAPDPEPGSPQDAFAISSVTLTGTGQ